MRILSYIVIIIGAFTISSSYAYTITIPDACGTEIYKVEHNKSTQKAFKLYLGSRFVLAEQLELCITRDNKDYGYLPCGSRDINDPNFMQNALINIQKSKAKLERFDEMSLALPELEEIIVSRRKFLELGIWKNDIKYQFYQTWDIKLLSKSFQGIEPPNKIQTIIQEIKHASSKYEKYRIVRKWGNIWNRYYHNNLVFSRKEEDKIWDDFVKKYNVTHKFKGTEDCI